MSLKILLADDSMTAQNMGKKILVDAGFEVITVSNGAAAVKKIAELKPEIIILDIYMPGYTGLEVCEKVKAAPDTANTPVLLTVGKLEPYRPEDGSKVQAEGVIIKPFEASDLLTALGKIAQKYNLKVPQIEPIEIKPREHVELPHDETYKTWKEDPDHESTVRIEHGTQTTPTVPPAEAAPAAAKAADKEPAYEKTMRLSAKDLQAMLAKGPSEAAKAAAAATSVTQVPVVAPPPPAVDEGEESTQKLEVPAFARDEAAPPAPVVAPEPEATSTPMFAIDEPAAEPSTPTFMIDEPAAETPVESPKTGAVKFVASSVPDEIPTAGLDVAGLHMDAMTSAPETSVYPSSPMGGVPLDYTTGAAQAAPAAAPAAETHHELETFAPAQEPETHQVDPHLETTAAAKVDAQVEHLMELETTHHQGSVEVEHVIDPALVTSNDDLMQFAVKFTEAPPEIHEKDPLAKDAAPLEASAEDFAHPAPVEEAPAPEAEEDKTPHSYTDDPLVQMGVISVQPPVEASPELAKEFEKPVTEEAEPEVLSPASGVVRALKEFESNTPTDETPVPVEDAPPVAAPVPEPKSEDENLKKFATQLHEAIQLMPATQHDEPMHVAEEAAEAAKTPDAPKDLSGQMAAINPAFSDKLPTPPEPPKEKVDTGHDHELASSLAAAMDSVAKEATGSAAGKTIQVSLEAEIVSRAVQKVFDRYKEQMISDITDELGKIK